MKLNVKTIVDKIHALSFYLIIGAVVLAEGVFTLRFLPPKVTDSQNTWQELSVIGSEDENIAAAIKTIDDQMSSDFETRFKKASAALPDEKKTSGVVTGISRLASSYKVNVDALEFSPGLISTASAATGFIPTNASGEIVTLTGVRATPVTLSVSGSLLSLAGFLSDLKSASQIMGLTVFDYSSKTSETSGTARVSLLIYYQPSKTTVPTWHQIKAISKKDLETLDALPEEDVFLITPPS